MTDGRSGLGDDQVFEVSSIEEGERVGRAGSPEGDLQHAEAVLYELAVLLRRVPLDEQTRDLHLRALHLKRDVAKWHEQVADESSRRAVLNELVRLRREASLCDKGSGPRRIVTTGESELGPVRRRSGSHDDGTT